MQNFVNQSHKKSTRSLKKNGTNRNKIDVCFKINNDFMIFHKIKYIAKVSVSARTLFGNLYVLIKRQSFIQTLYTNAFHQRQNFKMI